MLILRLDCPTLRNGWLLMSLSQLGLRIDLLILMPSLVTGLPGPVCIVGSTS